MCLGCLCRENGGQILRKKDKKFCVYMSQGRSPVEAAKLCGYKNIRQALLLLERSDIADEITQLVQQRKQLMKSLACAGFERIAFGSANDCVRLVMDGNLSSEEINNLDLYMISEIKKPKDGAIEIKFADRLKALEKLSMSTDEESHLPFYEALEKSASAWGGSNE